jgi:hypothetical protein
VPKSRGRKPSSRKPARPQTTSWQSDVVHASRVLLREDVTRTDAEAFASEVLGDVAAARRSPDEEALVDAAIVELTRWAGRKRTRQAAALVAALATVVDDPALVVALDEWARTQVADLAWVSQPPALPRAASVATDPYDDERITFLEYDDVVVVVQTSRGMGDAVTTANLGLPGVTSAWDETQDWPRHELSVPEAVQALRAAALGTELWWPPNDDEDYVRLRAMLAARLAAVDVPEPLEEPESQPLPDTERAALVDRFLSDEGLDGDSGARSVAEACVRFTDGWISGGALAWSPSVVERFLLDWAPREAELDDEARARLPALTAAFVGWALRERGVPQDAAAAAAHVALEVGG